MAAKVRPTTDVDPEVKKRDRIAPVESETTVSEWIQRAVVRELERERRSASPGDAEEVYSPSPVVELRVPGDPIKLRGGKSIAETVLDDRGDW